MSSKACLRKLDRVSDFHLVMLLLCLAVGAMGLRCSSSVDSTSGGDTGTEPPSDRLVVLSDHSLYDWPPKLMTDVEPEYPRLARQAGLEGAVWIDAFVNASGVVDSVRVGVPSEYGAFDNAASYVAWNREYRPAKKHGRPLGVWVGYRVVFSLESVYSD